MDLAATGADMLMWLDFGSGGLPVFTAARLIHKRMKAADRAARAAQAEAARRLRELERQQEEAREKREEARREAELRRRQARQIAYLKGGGMATALVLAIKIKRKRARAAQAKAVAVSDPVSSSLADQRILGVFEVAGRGLRAEDVCRSLETGLGAGQIRDMRAALQHLVSRGILTEPEPGQYALVLTK